VSVGNVAPVVGNKKKEIAKFFRSLSPEYAAGLETVVSGVSTGSEACPSRHAA
jgi:hypothetical protein